MHVYGGFGVYWVLIIVSIVVGFIEWYEEKPVENQKKWPRWTKFICVLIVAGIGSIGLLEGHFAKYEGLKAYKDKNFITAVEKLNVAYTSPFNTRAVIDTLGLSHKKLADNAISMIVAKSAYQKSIEYFSESRLQYPHSPISKNGLINVYRRLKDWEELDSLIISFENEIQTNFFKNDDGGNIIPNQKATYLTTLGNIFSDQDNPNRSDSRAVEYYQSALDTDPSNIFAILNMPPRLIDLAKSSPVNSKKRIGYLKTALHLSKAGLKLKDPSDKAFSALSLIQIGSMQHGLNINDTEFFESIKLVEKNKDDYENIDKWFVLVKAYLKLGNHAKAINSFNKALIFNSRFTKAHHELAANYWIILGKADIYPFLEIIDS
ncbi:tetratricopeptide repeat protein [Marinicella sediminis]|uniref:tetratricopeptide repeat protein n=1 Tax=Marinicella sediminis TaxID=1792834 RepID=UPI0018E2A8A6|nr:hypothetical protein [Marinicella sediminis]